VAAPSGGVAAQGIAFPAFCPPRPTRRGFLFCHAHRYLYLRGLGIAPYCHPCLPCYNDSCPAWCNSPRRRGARGRPARTRLHFAPLAAGQLPRVSRSDEVTAHLALVRNYSAKAAQKKERPAGRFSIAAPPPVRTTVPPGSHFSNVPTPPGRSHTTPSPPRLAPAPATTTPRCLQNLAVRCRPRAHTR
jgi:hypothetical protein